MVTDGLVSSYINLYTCGVPLSQSTEPGPITQPATRLCMPISFPTSTVLGLFPEGALGSEQTLTQNMMHQNGVKNKVRPLITVRIICSLVLKTSHAATCSILKAAFDHASRKVRPLFCQSVQSFSG